MKWKKQIIFLMILLVLLLISIGTHKIDFLDDTIYSFLDERRSNFLDITLLSVTTLLNVFIICIICIIFMILFDKKSKLLIPLNLLLITLISHIMKYFFLRPRPEANLIGETGYSLPSAHACVATAFFGFIIYLICHKNISSFKKILISIFGIILILLIGISRIYLGVHYFSDVAAGFLVGTIYLILYIHILEQYYKRSI